MATFEQQYEELFGEKINYDPITPKKLDDVTPPTPRLDLSQKTGPGISAPDDFQSKLDDLYAEITKPRPPAAEEPGGFEDFGRALIAGVGQVGEMALGGLEYGARQARERVGGVGGEVLEDVVGTLASGRRAVQEFDQDILSGMSQDALDRMQRHVLSLDPDNSIWRGGPGETLQSLALQFTQAIPATILTLLPAARWFKAGMTPGAVAYLGASEGALSMGGVANSIASEIEAMTDDELRAESPVFRQLLDQGYDPATARNKLIAAAQNNAPLLAGLTVGAISATAGRYLEPVFSVEGAPIARRFLVGAGVEGAQEAPQSAVEQYVANVAAHAYDPERTPWDDVLESGAQGFLIGGLTGGAFAGVLGSGPRPAETPAPEAAPAEPRAARAERPASFESVFGPNPDDTLTPPPGRVKNSNIVVEETTGGVTPEMRAALVEAGQLEMYLPQPGELAERGRQGTFGPLPQATILQQPPPRERGAPALPAGQLELPLPRRVRGGFKQDPTGQQPAPVDYSPDMTPPGGRYQDPRQETIFGRPRGVPDTPSAEPVADLLAQVQEMERPEADREAVYLSPDSVETLRKNGQLERFLERGVVLDDFDGKGGVLLARDRQVAESLLQLRDQGGDMQEILGLATGAGAGKPAAGVVVQRRDEAGNVVQESAVPEAEADALVTQWEKRYPNFDIRVLSAPAALRRRKLRLAQEKQKSERRKQLEARKAKQAEVSQQVRQATATTPSEAPVEQLGMKETARRVAAGATSPTKAAARLIGQAVRESAPAEQRRVGGFYPPSALEFKDAREAVRYANRFSKLVDISLESEMAAREADAARDEKFKGTAQDKDAQKWRKERSDRINAAEARRADAEKRKAEVLQELREIRERAKPTRKAARYVEAAARIAPEAVKKVHSEARVHATKRSEDVDEPGITLLGQEGAASVKDELSSDELGALTDKQIAALKDEKLDTAFKSAASWFAGRVQEGHETTVPFTSDVENLQAFAEKFVPPADRKRMRGARLYDYIVSRHVAPSMKRRFVKRVSALVRRKAHGGKVQSKPITKTSAAMKGRADIHRRKSKFNTQVLAADTIPQDEAASDRIQREAKARRVRDHLDKTLRRGAALLDKLQNDKFAKIANERTEEGDLTERARDMIHGRAYFRFLLQFGSAMHKSGNKGKPIINEMERLDEFLSNAIRMPAEDFARVMGRLLRAESHQQVTELRNFGEFKAKLADPETREEANAEILQELMADEARRTRLEEKWRKNPYYRSIVEPLMHKFTDSSFRDGYPSYKPTEEEMVRLQWVMKNWRADPTTREPFYDPIRRFFTLVGFEWTPTKRDGSGGELVIPYVESKNKADRGRRYVDGKPVRYKYSLPDRALEPLYVKKFGTEVSDDGGIRLGGPTEFKKPRAKIEVGPSEIRKVGKLLQANRVIAKFRSIIEKPKTTIAGMIRTEERLIRAFKELGMWTETSPVMGTVAYETPKAYRLVGPRLAAKEITKEEARKLLLKQIKPQPITSKWVDYEAAVRLGQRPLAAESEMFLEGVTDPGPSIEQFRKVGLEIQRQLSNREKTTTLAEVLDVMLEGLPENHVYHSLAQRLLQTPGILDTPVSWDWRGQLHSKQSGAAKWEDDQRTGGRFRYILLNNKRINSMPEPQASLLHTVLHEAVHIATQGALDRSPAVHAAFKELQTIARRFMRNEGGRSEANMPYGLRDLDPVGEFVAEAFSNLRFQQMLKRIRFDRTSSLWQRFVNAVKRLLGVDSDVPEPRNAFEAVMSLQHHLFTGEDRIPKGQRTMALEEVDPAVRPVVQQVTAGMNKIGDTFKQMWARAKSPNAPLIAMSMRQIHKEFRRHFGVGKNSFDRYIEGWENRNAENSRLMEEGERVSRQWTEATERTSATQALEFSRLLTEATLYGMHIDVPSTAPQNQHLKSDEQKKRAGELARRFAALDPRWHALYKRVRKYYQETLEREVDLLMLNALRGVLASGERAVMSRTEFDKRYNEQTVRKLGLTTKEGLEREFGDLDKTMLRTLQEIASIPTQREGPYFPLTRYGEFVVYAERVAEKKSFSDSKQAFAYRAQKLSEDPTLDVNVSMVSDNEHVVYVTERDFRTAESRTEAEELKQEMIDLYGREAVTDVQLKDTFSADQTIQSGSALASILTTLDGNAKAQNAVKNFWLRSLADRSFRKHQIRRKQRRGVDFDLQHRSFTNYVKQASYYISQLKFGWRMADAFREMREFVRDSRDTPEITSVRLGQVRDELRKRDEMTADIEEIPKLVRRGTEIGQLYMLFGPSYWLINMTQPYLVTLPWLSARYGLGASAALINAQKMIAHPLLTATKDSWGGAKAILSKTAAERAFNVLDQVKDTIKKRGGDRSNAYIQMLDQLRQQSVIDLSWIAELRDISEGRNTSWVQKTMDATRIMSHLTEVNNRIVTALAAYDLRYTEVMARQGATHELAHNAAVQTAKDAVAETQFDYSGSNKPRLFTQGGPAGRMAPLVFQFMQWSQHMYAMLISNMVAAVNGGTVDKATARKTLLGLLATHAAVGGVLGVALQPLKWAIGLALMAMFGDDEPYDFAGAMSGDNFDRATRELLASMLGNELGAVAAQGLPELAGVRLTDRMSLGTVYYLDLKTETAESTLGSLVKSFGGPWLSMGYNGFRASQYMMEGEVYRGIETAMPKFGRDIMRALRFSTDGIVNNAGDTIIQSDGVSPWQLFLQATGFQPSEISEFYSRQALQKDTEALGEERRNSLLRRFRNATTIEARQRVLAEAAEFNKAFPAAAVTRSSLLRAVQAKAEREAGFKNYGAALRGRSILYGSEGEFYDVE